MKLLEVCSHSLVKMTSSIKPRVSLDTLTRDKAQAVITHEQKQLLGDGSPFKCHIRNNYDRMKYICFKIIDMFSNTVVGRAICILMCFNVRHLKHKWFQTPSFSLQLACSSLMACRSLLPLSLTLCNKKQPRKELISPWKKHKCASEIQVSKAQFDKFFLRRSLLTL